jgi:tight adherence protein B
VSRRVRRRLARLHQPRHAAATGAKERLTDLLDGHRWLSAAGVAAVAAAAAGAAAGPVAAVVAAAYGAVVTGSVLGRRRAGRLGRDRVAVLDAIATLAADLRAGLSPAAAMAEALPALNVSSGAERSLARSLGRLSAAWQLSERLGAPLADLLDRVEADLRAAERVRLSVAAQTAGAQATTWVLAALPLAGVGLGYGMGVDPARSLLHTPLGAGCAFGALALQCAGLAWASLLVRGAIAEATT